MTLNWKIQSCNMLLESVKTFPLVFAFITYSLQQKVRCHVSISTAVKLSHPHTWEEFLDTWEIPQIGTTIGCKSLKSEETPPPKKTA